MRPREVAWLGWRLGGWRISRLPLLGAAGAGLTVAVMLLAVGGVGAEQRANDRAAWLNSAGNHVGDDGVMDVEGDLTLAAGSSDVGPYEVTIGRSQVLMVEEIVDVAEIAAGSDAPVPAWLAGLGRLPAPGEWVASPALVGLLDAAPVTDHSIDQLPGGADGRVGVIGEEGLSSPDSLVALIGVEADRISPFWQATAWPTAAALAVPAAVLAGAILIVGVLLATLVGLQVAAAARASAALREMRLRTLLLTGAPPSVVARIAAVDGVVIGAVASVAGIGLAWLLRWPVAAVGIGRPWWPADVVPDVMQVALVVALVLGCSFGASVWSVRRLIRGRIAPDRKVHLVPRLAFVVLALAAPRWFVRTDGSDAALTAASLAAVVVAVALMGSPVAAGCGWLVSRLRLGGLLAGRALRSNPTAAARPLASLAIGIAASTAVVAVVGTNLVRQEELRGSMEWSGPDLVGAAPPGASRWFAISRDDGAEFDAAARRDAVARSVAAGADGAIVVGSFGNVRLIDDQRTGPEAADGASSVRTDTIGVWVASCADLVASGRLRASSCAPLMVNDETPPAVRDGVVGIGGSTAPDPTRLLPLTDVPTFGWGRSAANGLAEPFLIVDPSLVPGSGLDDLLDPGLAGPPTLVQFVDGPIDWDRYVALVAAAGDATQILPDFTTIGEVPFQLGLAGFDDTKSGEAQQLLVQIAGALLVLSAVAAGLGGVVTRLVSRRGALTVLTWVGVPIRVLGGAFTVETVLPAVVMAALGYGVGLWVAWTMVSAVPELEVIGLVDSWPWAPAVAVAAMAVGSLVVLPLLPRLATLRSLQIARE